MSWPSSSQGLWPLSQSETSTIICLPLIETRLFWTSSINSNSSIPGPQVSVLTLDCALVVGRYRRPLQPCPVTLRFVDFAEASLRVKWSRGGGGNIEKKGQWSPEASTLTATKAKARKDYTTVATMYRTVYAVCSRIIRPTVTIGHPWGGESREVQTRWVHTSFKHWAFSSLASSLQPKNDLPTLRIQSLPTRLIPRVPAKRNFEKLRKKLIPSLGLYLSLISSGLTSKINCQLCNNPHIPDGAIR